LKRFDIKQEVFYANLDWDSVLNAVNRNNITFKEIPKFPEVTRDFALLLDDSITFQKVYDIAWSTEKKLLKKVNLFDVYTGKNLPDGKKSYAVSFTLMDENKTLTDKQIDKIMGKLLTQYQKQLGAELR
jgi:phenylalanyl-tRNA synthetase beta chain